MKQMIVIIGLAVIAILVSLTLLSTENRKERQDELNRAVSAAVKQAVSASQITGQKEITTNKELVAEFMHLMNVGIKSDGELSVEVMGANYRDGMLDVLVTEKFVYPNGRNGEISIRKCAIYE